MADSRLQWHQLNVAAPNLSGLLSEMRGGINDATTAASDILGKYQEGSQLKAENELIKRIGGMDQEQLRTAFEQGKFNDLNLGATGIEYLNRAMGDRANIRSTNVNSDQTQASIGWGNDTNSRANAAESRVASEFSDNIQRRNTLRDFAGLGVQADAVARQLGTANSGTMVERAPGEFNRIGDHVFGNADSGQGPVNGNTGPISASDDTRLRLARTLQAEAGNQGPEGMLAVGAVIRNRAASGKYGDGIDGVIMRKGQFSAWNGETNYRNGEQGQNMNFQPNAEAMAAADAILAGQYKDITGGATHYYNPAVSQPAWGGPISERPIDTNSALTGYQQALINSGQFTADEIQQYSNGIRAAAIEGDTRNQTQQTNLQNDILAGIAEQVSLSPNAINNAEAENMIRSMLLETGQFSQAEALEAARRGTQIINESEGLGSNLSGGSLDAGVTGAIESAAANTIADASRQFQGQDQYRALNDIGRYVDDPTTSLENDLGIPSDPETRGDYDSNNLRKYINELADKKNVEPSVMAVAMRDAFVRDPGDSSNWWDVDWTKNTIENRFDPEIIDQTIAQLTPERRREFDRGRADINIIEGQLNQNTSQQRQVLSRLNKLDPNNPDDARQREQLLSRLDQLEQAAALLSRQSPTEGR